MKSWRVPSVARLLSILFLLGRVHGAEQEASLAQSFEQRVKPFLNRNCERCHNLEKMKSGIRVDHLDARMEDQHLRLWETMAKQLRDKVMPPEDEPQPSDTERAAVTDWIEQALEIARSRPVPKNGSVRRLTVAQYRNTLRELLLLEEDLADLLPPDAVSRDGFSNNQETLQLSPLLLETYLELAEKALARSVVDPKSKPVIQNFRVDLGRAINPQPCPDELILGADSLLLNNADFAVHQLIPAKPFDFAPYFMRTKFRFIEGYQGNDTVRGWREYDSIYHAVFACLRGHHGYPKGRAYSTVPEGLLLRPAIPSAEQFGVESTYGPKANFKISLRELPDHGRFRVTVTAAKYDDGLLLDPGDSPAPDHPRAIVCRDFDTAQTVMIQQAGLYQVDVFTTNRNGARPRPDRPGRPVASPPGPDASKDSRELQLTLGGRHFSSLGTQPAFLVVRLSSGPLVLHANLTGPERLERVVLTPLAGEQAVARRFALFEKRAPWLGVHLGLRRDCGSTLTRVGEAQMVSNASPSRFVFEGAIRDFPSPDVEKDNVNYLAGIREIGVRNEYTDGRDAPRLLIRSVEFEGPYWESWPPPSHRNVFMDFARPRDWPAYAREIIRTFATRAYRRPVSGPEESALMAVFEKSRGDGASFEAAVQEALQVVLVSPAFLFLIENSGTPEPEPLDDYELASKLSYFLWNGPPDQALLRLAAVGALRARLEDEVGRMIEDPRFSRFVGEFTSQWLALDKFDVLEPDRARFPKLTRDTRAQLRQEPVRFVEHLFRHNLPVRHLIESDLVVANEIVAAYYDLADRTEHGFQFVPVRHGRSDLGGLLTQASILAGLSDGRESNPVKRGAWLARRIVGEPPDDPPPNVPALPEETRELSLRERIERHRNQPGCVQCHTKIDPWGIPFEEFDAGGRLKPQVVDARSTLPDRTEVAGVNELKRYLAQDRLDQVAFSFLRHLVAYATGRTPSYSENQFLKQNGAKLKASGYRMQEMIQFVVQSPMFLEK